MVARWLVAVAVALTISLGAADSSYSQAAPAERDRPATEQRPERTDPLLGLELETLRGLFRAMEEEIELLRERVDALEARLDATEQ